MTSGWHSPTLMMYGCDGLAPWLTGRSERSTTLLVDPAVADAEIVARIRKQLARAGRADTGTVVVTGPGGLPGLTGLAGRLGALVVAVGGGSLLDRAKLAVLLRSDPRSRARLEVPQRSGLILLPPAAAPRPTLVAVPTTLGTGSETSAVACLDTPQGKRLVMGGVLRAEAAVVDPVATASLPDGLRAEGVLEVLFRIAGLYVGDHRDLPTEDALAEALALRTVRLGDELVRAPGDAVRAEIAKVSGLSHAGWVVLGRAPYAGKGWYLANELSSALGLRKMTAIAALWPPLWRAVAAGDTRLGSARRLARLWSLLRTAGPAGLPADPAAGIAALIDAWGVDRRITADATAPDAVAARAVRAWGAGLPMLDGLSAADLADLIRQAVRTPRPAAA
ncbi:daptide-type RiPP biosynthesis dehydogenase [Streptomyces sp. NPDC047017]|uniref:daptide-type RiPP biosynthesis dehydogenase n=1 Tax=Streptomyces sp. NPDC047017 TaxID=3155024 RepID=UPI00340C9F6D